MRLNNAARETMIQGSTRGRGEMKEWKGEEEAAYPLSARVIRQALLEVLSQLNATMETNTESFTSLSIHTMLLSIFLQIINYICLHQINSNFCGFGCGTQGAHLPLSQTTYTTPLSSCSIFFRHFVLAFVTYLCIT